MWNCVSLNGMLAREDGSEDWLPVEGWDEFAAEAERSDNFVVGREGYELVQKLYPDHNFDDIKVKSKVVVSTRALSMPNEYIVAHSPQEAIGTLIDRGTSRILLVGGGKLNSSFMKHHLVDEVWLIIAPFILGAGRPFIAHEQFDVPLTLLESDTLSHGRILLKYSVN